MKIDTEMNAVVRDKLLYGYCEQLEDGLWRGIVVDPPIDMEVDESTEYALDLYEVGDSYATAEEALARIRDHALELNDEEPYAQLPAMKETPSS